MSSKLDRPTLAQIRAWPATVNVEKGAAALGCSRGHAYEQIKAGRFPARTLSVGNRIVVVTSSIIALLDN